MNPGEWHTFPLTNGLWGDAKMACHECRAASFPHDLLYLFGAHERKCKK